jgi:hypothetical protein
MILLVGAKGVMGRRYSTILNYLGVQHISIDKGDSLPALRFDGVIIATPTDDHYQTILNCRNYGVPILCEKPITMDKLQLDHILASDIDLQMVNQYEHMQMNSWFGGATYYDYWNTGKDGVAWDCINIIGLSNRIPKIRTTSPIWKCQLNGSGLYIRDMDYSYIKMIDAWLKKKESNKDYIEQAHQRVLEGRYTIDN